MKEKQSNPHPHGRTFQQSQVDDHRYFLLCVFFLNQEWRRILGSSRCTSVDPKMQPCLSDSCLITALLPCIGRLRSRSPVYVKGSLKHYRLLPRGKKFISAGFFCFLVDVQKSSSGEPRWERVFWLENWLVSRGPEMDQRPWGRKWLIPNVGRQQKM